MSSRFVPVFLLLLVVAGGCADPVLQWHSMVNPYRIREWQEDEAYLTTLHTKLETLKEIRPRLATLAPQDQQAWARTLQQIIEQDDNVQLRATATTTLANLPLPLAESGLRAAAKDSSAAVRIASCEAWSKVGGDSAVTVLAELLGSETELDVQLSAARALSNFRDPRAIAALGLALETKDPALQFRATQSLAQITPVDYGRDVVAWKQYLQGGRPQPPSSSLLARLPLPWPF